MLSIKNNVKQELVVNKSHFITELISIDNVIDVKECLLHLKDQYNGASHYCYAYIIDNNKRCSDNGEPKGTAGAPILNVLETSNLNHILCVVIRYYGGVKLGTGGLVRTYKEAVTNTLKKAETVTLLPGLIIHLAFNYDISKQIDYLLKDYKIINKEYTDTIIYSLELTNNEYKDIETKLINLCLYITILKKIYVKK